MKARSEETSLSAAWVLQELKSIVERSTKPGEFYNGAVANRALELIGKHLGMFVERVDHSGEVTISSIKRTIVDPGKS